ncbi:MAG TPA: hypothetical protein VGR43_09215 [Dehalococcoidia bacterium]|nr:hypothetical protein [Dehalococcoidia bacterium]
MVSRFDEYLVHQTEQPLARVASDHPEWQDRFYFNIHDRNGEVAVITGVGAYPNRDMMQGYIFAAQGGEHYTSIQVRAPDNDREVMTVGSLSFSVVEPLKTWRLEVADEAQGIRGALEFRARCPLYTFSPIHWRNGENVVVNQLHYTQAGVYEGSLTIGDRTFTDLIGMRDRSWGVRDMARVPFWVWVSAQFDEFCISAWLWETPEGDVIHADGAIIHESGEIRPVTGIEHKLELWPGTKRPKTARYRLTMADGKVESLTASEAQTIFLAPGMARWAESDGEALKQADASAFGFDQQCRFELNGETGSGIVEYMVTGGHQRYGIPPFRVP